MPREITKEEFAEWLQHPVTQLVKQVLNRRREDLKESWASGDFTAEGKFGTEFLDARALGGCRAYLDMVNMDVDTVNSELKDE